MGLRWEDWEEGRKEGRKEGEKGCVAEVDFWGGEDFINLAKVVKFS